MTDDRGMALLDTIVSCGLCSLIAATAIPFVAGSLERERTIIGAGYLAGQLHRVRAESLKQARSVAIRFELTDTRLQLQIFADGNGNGVSQRDIDTGIDPALAPPEFLDTRARDVSLRINQVVTEIDGTRVLSPGDDPLRIGSTALVCFSPLGGATSGTLYVAAPHGPQMAVRIFGGTGRVRVLTFNAQARQWQP